MAFKTLTRWYGSVFNKGNARRLRTNPGSRLHGTHLLLTVTGRRTGRAYEIPVNYRDTTAGTPLLR